MEQEKYSINEVSLFGFLDSIQLRDSEKTPGITYVSAKVVTSRLVGKDEEGKRKNEYTFHDVSYRTDNPKEIEKFKSLQPILERNQQIYKKQIKGKVEAINVRVKGAFNIVKNEVDNFKTKKGKEVKTTFYNTIIKANTLDVQVQKLSTDKSNEIHLKGRIARIGDKEGNIIEKDDKKFIPVSVATFYSRPITKEEYEEGLKRDESDGKKVHNFAELTNQNGEAFYVENIPTFHEMVISNSDKKKSLFNLLEQGALEVGDRVDVIGQIYSTSNKDKDGITRYENKISVKDMNLVQKKDFKQDQKQEVKQEEKKEVSLTKKTAQSKRGPKL